MMRKAGLSSCCEHFHLSGGTPGRGQGTLDGSTSATRSDQQRLGRNAKKDLEHCSWGTAREVRKQANS